MRRSMDRWMEQLPRRHPGLGRLTHKVIKLLCLELDPERLEARENHRSVIGRLTWGSQGIGFRRRLLGAHAVVSG